MSAQFVRIGKRIINLSQVAYIKFGETWDKNPCIQVGFPVIAGDDFLEIWFKDDDYELAVAALSEALPCLVDR